MSIPQNKVRTLMRDKQTTKIYLKLLNMKYSDQPKASLNILTTTS